ncbi:MAG: LytTR family transcriptional regulator DNA-binding domain-containing protein [Wujia sp.]
MLKVGICDMDEKFVNHLVEMLREILYQYTDWEAHIFTDNREVTEAIEAGTFDCNLLFLDIFQSEGSGLEISKLLEKKHVDTDVIFVTTSRTHVMKCYRKHTFAYLLKPLKEQDIATEVNRYLQEMKLNPKCLNISVQGEHIRIPLDIILFIESNYRKIVVHTKTKDYEYYDKLDYVEQILAKDGFVRCHQSYLVPISRVTTYNSTVIQVGEYAVPISRKYKDVVKKAMQESEIISTIVEKTGDTSRHSYLSSGLFQHNDTKGALICVDGKYLGKIVRIVPEQTIMIGRDSMHADMIVNLPLVSRTHCTIIYHEQDNNYEVCDCSTNGTFIDKEIRLIRGNTYLLSPGTTICFGDKQVVYKLG